MNRQAARRFDCFAVISSEIKPRGLQLETHRQTDPWLFSINALMFSQYGQICQFEHLKLNIYDFPFMPVRIFLINERGTRMFTRCVAA